MKSSRIFIIIGVLLLASPVLHAQDFLRKAKNYLDAGECEKALRAYDAYEVENPGGNTEMDRVQGICPKGWHLPSWSEWEQLVNYVYNQPMYYCNMKSNVRKALASAYYTWKKSEY